MVLETVRLPWDSDFFGFPVARIGGIPRLEGELGGALSRLKRDGVRLAYWECPPENEQANRDARNRGGRLVNGRAVLVRDLSGGGPADGFAEELGAAVDAGDHATLLELAWQSGAQSRFRLDPDIPTGRFQHLYRMWMENSIAGTIADAVLVRRVDERIAGMITVSAQDGAGQIGLFGVLEAARGKGVGSGLLNGALAWFAARSCNVVRVATQRENQAALAVYHKAAFRLESLTNFYHFWI